MAGPGPGGSERGSPGGDGATPWRGGSRTAPGVRATSAEVASFSDLRKTWGRGVGGGKGFDFIYVKVSTKGPPTRSAEQSRGQRPSPGAAGEGRVGSVGRGGEGAGVGAATLLFLMTYLETVSNLRKHCQAGQRTPTCPSSRRPRRGPFTASLRHAFPRACVRAWGVRARR